MRIGGGQAGGRALQAPRGFDVRPTPALVKQAIFNSLGTRTEGAEVLELFGGSGALSLEALSRGAVRALIVEKSPRTARMIRQNFDALGLAAGRFELRTQDAFVAVAQLVQLVESVQSVQSVQSIQSTPSARVERRFDLIFADPPYGEKNVGRRSASFAQKLLDDPGLPALLTPGGTFVLGHSKRDSLELPSVWRERKLLRHGDSIMRFLERSSPAQPLPEQAPDDPAARPESDLS